MATQRLPHWSIDCFERMCVSLECDMLKGRALNERLVVKRGQAVGAGYSTQTQTLSGSVNFHCAAQGSTSEIY